jgi:dipeptide/tripeptide permease
MAFNGLFAKFPRVFWVVNTLELVERGAYYGMLAALPYHMVYNLHIRTELVGLLLSLLTPFLYILPIISGALAGKYGFRAVMVPAFLLIAAGYALAGTATTFELMLVSFMILGIGTGTFKPMTSGTIATTTSEGTRNLGYSIYYWMINVGSFLMPLTVAVAVPKEQYGLVFFISSGLMAANFALSFLFFRNPVEPDPKKSVSGVLAGAALVLRDYRFMILLVIYSGFWFMYAVNNAAITLFMVDFKVWDVAPAMVAVVNPITILAAGPFLGKLVEKFDSLHAMIGGMAIFTAGLMMMGIPGSWPFFVSGIVIFSVAEFIVHPTYISYVSKIAPKDKVPVYMGYSFIPALIGYSSGNFLVALLYTIFSEEAHRPKFFWAIIGSVGLFTIACLMLYSQYLGRKRAVEEAGAEEAPMPYPPPSEALAGTDRVAPSTVRSGKTNHPVWESKLTVAVALLVIPGLLFGGYSGGTDRYFRDGGTMQESSWSRFTLTTGLAGSSSGHSDENTDTTFEVEVPGSNMVNVTFTLKWTDEPDIRRLVRVYENQPDEFGLEVTAPNGTVEISSLVKNPPGAEGSVSVSVKLDPGKPGEDSNPGPFSVTVRCGTCGDLTNPYSATLYTDTGNDWELEISHTYYTRK